jgi:hypothetical protein
MIIKTDGHRVRKAVLLASRDLRLAKIEWSEAVESSFPTEDALYNTLIMIEQAVVSLQEIQSSVNSAINYGGISLGVLVRQIGVSRRLSSQMTELMMGNGESTRIRNPSLVAKYEGRISAHIEDMKRNSGIVNELNSLVVNAEVGDNEISLVVISYLGR